MSIHKSSIAASLVTPLQLAQARLKRAIERVVDEPDCAQGWIWMQQEILARDIQQNPAKALELTLTAAEGWERQVAETSDADAR